MKTLPEKKRHNFLLTEDNLSWVQDWFKRNRLPRTTTALLIDEFILSLRKTITELERKKADGENVSVGDLFAITGLNAELEKLSKK